MSSHMHKAPLTFVDVKGIWSRRRPSAKCTLQQLVVLNDSEAWRGKIATEYRFSSSISVGLLDFGVLVLPATLRLDVSYWRTSRSSERALHWD